MVRRSHRIGLWSALALVATLGPASIALAGNVMVGGVTPGGGLTITDDIGNNDFTVTQNTDGSVTVTATPGSGTTINGGASHTTPAPATGGTPVTGKIKVSGKGGDDNITIDGVNQASDIEVKDTQGTNNVTIKNTNVPGRLRVKNGPGGKTDISDSKWGSRKIDGGATVTPANLGGRGGGGQIGTPPARGGTPTPTPTPGGKKAAKKKAAKKKASSSKPPLNAQGQGLPTNNPGQRGMLPDVPSVPQQPGYSPKSPPVIPKYK